MTARYPNKRMMIRKGGRFAKQTAADVGIGGACPTCRHILIRVYDGDPNNIDPRGFRFRCFTCEPETEAEREAGKARTAAEPKFSLADFMERGQLVMRPLPIAPAKCNCGHPAAQVLSLWSYLFHADKARRIAAAAISGKCVPCYQIDLWIAECLKNPKNCDGG